MARWPGSALDAAERTFELLTSLPGPRPRLAGQDLRRVRQRLLAPPTPPQVRDQLWTQLVDQHRQQASRRGEWTVIAVAMAVPGLRQHARQLAGGRRDVEDLHAEMVEGFLRELDRVDTTKPHIVGRLLWAARRAGLRLQRSTAQQPQPAAGTDLDLLPTPSHLDERLALWLYRLLEEAAQTRVIGPDDREFIRATRLDHEPLGRVAARHGISPQAVRARRTNAERRLATAWRAGRLPRAGRLLPVGEAA